MHALRQRTVDRNLHQMRGDFAIHESIDVGLQRSGRNCRSAGGADAMRGPRANDCDDTNRNDRAGDCDASHATSPLAKDDAAMRAAAPRSRGYCSDGTTMIGVAPADGVSARSASPARTVGSIKSQAVVISPPMYTCDGSIALTTDPRPRPRYLAVDNSAASALPSPARARTTRSSTVSEATSGRSGRSRSSRPKYRERVPRLET